MNELMQPNMAVQTKTYFFNLAKDGFFQKFETENEARKIAEVFETACGTGQYLAIAVPVEVEDDE